MERAHREGVLADVGVLRALADALQAERRAVEADDRDVAFLADASFRRSIWRSAETTPRIISSLCAQMAGDVRIAGEGVDRQGLGVVGGPLGLQRLDLDVRIFRRPSGRGSP